MPALFSPFLQWYRGLHCLFSQAALPGRFHMKSQRAILLPWEWECWGRRTPLCHQLSSHRENGWDGPALTGAEISGPGPHWDRSPLTILRAWRWVEAGPPSTPASPGSQAPVCAGNPDLRASSWMSPRSDWRKLSFGQMERIPMGWNKGLSPLDLCVRAHMFIHVCACVGVCPPWVSCRWAWEV